MTWAVTRVGRINWRHSAASSARIYDSTNIMPGRTLPDHRKGDWASVAWRNQPRSRLSRNRAMPITPFLTGQAFEPEVVDAMSVAFDAACKSLGLRPRSDPASELVAKKIVELAQRGVRDPARLSERVLHELKLGD
jgi:hypothetical protein